MNLETLVGETLDGKYRIERELGRGGMGAVYLSTHLGTERPVAVKVIAPQFMQRPEFVERFRREARAAGRLRHPNVVDVTDFGFADMKDGRVAYLVMEYLDGCTLGEILEEEKKLPLSWTLDILEQISSAIHEAHGQGIVHRDLKPDNIWLEPNQRGGYTVKVLDFGIAKLETVGTENLGAKIGDSPLLKSSQTQEIRQNKTFSDENSSPTVSDNSGATAASEKQTITDARNSKTFAAEAGTLIRPLAEISSESGTAILPKFGDAEPDSISTKILTAPENQRDSETSSSSQNSALTRVGAVLGTPLYMSPEQCRGEHLDARSDIYSLAVIAYQMISGKTPFAGDFKAVMEAHKETVPPSLDAKKIPKKVKQTIMAALAKKTDDRPPSAEAFASRLRAQSEGIGTLLRRALTIYSEHLPKFLGLTILLYLPLVFFTVLRVTVSLSYAEEIISRPAYVWLNAIVALITVFAGIFSGYTVFGTATWIVTQILAMPLRPVSLRPALEAAGKKWKTFAVTGMVSATLTMVGYALCLLPGLFLSVIWALVAPVVMMENLRGRAALKRSKVLVMRSVRTTSAAIFIMFLVPFFTASLISFLVATTVKSFSETGEKIMNIRQEIDQSNETNSANENNKTAYPEVEINVGNSDSVKIINKEASQKPQLGGINGIVHEILTTILTLPLQILIASLSSIIAALLYLKTRQIGGESIHDLLAQFEAVDQPHSNWQKRVRERLLQSGRVTSKHLSVERQSKS